MSAVLRPPLPGPGATQLHWPALHAGARALALAAAVRADTRPWSCVVADARELERLAVELRFFGGPELEILTLPDWEILPYDQFSPHPDIVSERLATLARLPELRRGILLLTTDSLLARLPPRGLRECAQLRAAASARRWRSSRAACGWWRQVTPASARSTGLANLRCAARCLTCGRWAPARRCASTCSTIRSIHCGASIRTPSARNESIESLRLLPAREVPLDADAVREFRRRFRLRFSGDVTRMSVYRGVSEGLAPPGIEFYLPLFFERTASLMDYLPADLVFAHRSGPGERR